MRSAGSSSTTRTVATCSPAGRGELIDIPIPVSTARRLHPTPPCAGVQKKPAICGLLACGGRTSNEEPAVVASDGHRAFRRLDRDLPPHLRAEGGSDLGLPPPLVAR